MKIHNLSTCIITDKVDESREFYTKYFGAKIMFDCGWYISLRFGCETSNLEFMSPQAPAHKLCNTAGLTYNMGVADVDAEHARLTGLGLVPTEPLEDHPWGDRGFAVSDPNGVQLYIYTEIEPTEEFKQFYK